MIFCREQPGNVAAWPDQGGGARNPGNAAACFTQFAICASSRLPHRFVAAGEAAALIALIVVYSPITGKKHPKSSRFSTLFKGLATPSFIRAHGSGLRA
jgi:hypothetical protein